MSWHKYMSSKVFTTDFHKRYCVYPFQFIDPVRKAVRSLEDARGYVEEFIEDLLEGEGDDDSR